jgi:regulatory protein
VTKEADKQQKKDPWPAALRILSRRDYSCSELRNKLIEKGFGPELVEETLKRCFELGYLNDERFAANRAISLMRQGRAVGYRLLQDLRQRGIGEELAESALAKARETLDEDRLLDEILSRRFADFNYNAAPAREKRRVVNFLQRRGFSLGLIMEHFQRKGSMTNDEDR